MIAVMFPQRFNVFTLRFHLRILEISSCGNCSINFTRRVNGSLLFIREGIFLPACRRLLFPLLHAEKGRLRNAVANRVPASRWQDILFRINCEIISG